LSLKFFVNCTTSSIISFSYLTLHECGVQLFVLFRPSPFGSQ
jgi:hypothetical protein